MRFMVALGLPLFLVACEPANTHALARVNGVEISARQLPNQQALEKIIDRELLVQKALAETIDNARRRLLAQAYVERRIAQMSTGSAKPTRDEVRAFYNQNPALFAERRIYRIRELTITETAAAPADLAEGDLEQVVASLRSRGARFSLTTQTQAAEELPLAYLPRLSRMKPGEVAVFGRTAIQLIHAEDAPLAPEQSYALIEQFLAGKKRMELAAAEVKKLREGARIEYVAQVKR